MSSKLPKRLTKKLCRVIGIIHGDGNMSSSRIHITDKCLDYHIQVLQPLFKDVFNLELNLFHDKNRNSYYSHVKDKKVYKYLTETLEIPKGAVRKNLKIPNYIKSLQDSLKASYISGLFDAECYISKRQAEISFSITCQEIFEFIKEFLNNKNKTSRKNITTSYSFSYPLKTPVVSAVNAASYVLHILSGCAVPERRC